MTVQEIPRKPEPVAPIVTPARLEAMESGAECYRRIEKDILALPADRVGRVTADVGQATAIALGALPNLLTLKQDFKAFADSDSFIKKLDRLQDHAMAALYAHVRSTPAISEKETLELLERGKPIREQLLTVAEGLVTFGLFDAALVSGIREGKGHLDIAKDLITLGALYNANWESVSAKVPFGIQLVQEASAIGANLVQAIGRNEVKEVRSDASFDWPALRARAFRLFVEEYDQIRRAVTFVRWSQGDANAFVPSLHSTGRRTPSRSDDRVPESELEPPSTPAPTNGTAVAEPGMPNDTPFEE